MLLSALGLLTIGYAFRLIPSWEEITSLAEQIVMSSAGDGVKEVTGESGPVDRGARQPEVSRLSERERADSSASVTAPLEGRAHPPAETFEREHVERLMQLLEKSEATWAEGYNAERERADGIARDLATVRAELANRIAAEAAARAEVARMATMLEDKEAEWTKKLAAEREKAEAIAKDSPSEHAESGDRGAAEASAPAADETTTRTTTGSAMTHRVKTIGVSDSARTKTIDAGIGSISETLFGFQSRSRASTRDPGKPRAAKRERRESRSVRVPKQTQKPPTFARTPSFGFF